MTARRLVRFFVCIHTVALFALPKDSLGLISIRPEDITGGLLLILGVFLVTAGSMQVPRGPLTPVVLFYGTFFGVVLVARDYGQGYFEATVFWLKEMSCIVYGYFIWRVYRSATQQLLTIAVMAAVPNLLYGLFQLVAGPRGLYGASPWGHEVSPASSGIVFFGYSVVFLLGLQAQPRRRRYWMALALSLTLVAASGSKIAVVGAVGFYGAYLLLGFTRELSVKALVRVLGFAAASIAAVGFAAIAVKIAGPLWGNLERYYGFLEPWEVIRQRGIWWKIGWIDGPLSAIVGAGYSPSHVAADQNYSFGMAMDNQLLYFAVTGGLVGVAAYTALMTAVFRTLPVGSSTGRVLRALVVSYLLMGLGGEVLQLSTSGNLFWMMVGWCLAIGELQPGLAAQEKRRSPRSQKPVADGRLKDLTAPVH